MGEDAATNTETEIENVDTTTTTTAVSEGKKTTQGSSMASRLLRWWTLGRKDMNAPLVTVIRLSGVLATPVGGMPGGQARRMLYLDRVEKWISKAFFKPLRPDACAIIVNSPGGSPVQSELIHEAIRTAAKDSGVPVFTFAEDVAASGGYWLMCAGDESFACSTSLVGSIGVVSATFGAVEAAKKLGIERRVYASGEDKVPLDPFLPVSSEQEDRLRHVMEDVHDSFKELVRSRRGDRLRAPENEMFSGRIYSGNQAAAAGLVDGVGSYREVMKKRFGERTKFLLCSDPPQSGLRELLGLNFKGYLESMFENKLEDATRAAISGSLDELEHKALWSNFKLN